MGFYGSNDPTNSVKALKEVVVLSICFNPTRSTSPCYNTTHACNTTYTEMNLSTVKWAQWDKTQSRELLGLFICVCIALCTIVAHNSAQNRPDNFPSYPPDNHHCSDDVYLGGGHFVRELSPRQTHSQTYTLTQHTDKGVDKNYPTIVTHKYKYAYAWIIFWPSGRYVTGKMSGPNILLLLKHG